MSKEFKVRSYGPKPKEKALENRLRRMADRRGLKLMKSRRRDPRAVDFGGYALVDQATNGIVYGTGHIGRITASLDEIEDFLNQP
jgi:hypothetical protein